MDANTSLFTYHYNALVREIPPAPLAVLAVYFSLYKMKIKQQDVVT